MSHVIHKRPSQKYQQCKNWGKWDKTSTFRKNNRIDKITFRDGRSLPFAIYLFHTRYVGNIRLWNYVRGNFAHQSEVHFAERILFAIENCFQLANIILFTVRILKCWHRKLHLHTWALFCNWRDLNCQRKVGIEVLSWRTKFVILIWFDWPELTSKVGFVSGILCITTSFAAEPNLNNASNYVRWLRITSSR